MKKRLVNLDLLRVITMIMIITLHYLGKGGALYSTNEKVLVVAWFIEYLSIVAVNIFVLISGYFLIDSKFKWSKVLKLSIEVWFYSLIIIIINLLTFHDVSKLEIIHSIFPISFKQYWFITMYLLMYIISPFLNILINNITKKQHFSLIMILIITFGIINFITLSFDVSLGYSIMWFVSLYLIAAFIKKYVKERNSFKYKLFCFLTYLFTSIILTIIHFTLSHFAINYPILEGFKERLLGYNNIFVIISSISLFLLFRSFNIKNKTLAKIVELLVPTLFGIYLIHDNEILRIRIYNGILNSEKYTYNGIIYFIAILFVSVISIFIICSLIDMLRILLFKLISKIKPINKFNKKKKNLFDNFLEKI